MVVRIENKSDICNVFRPFHQMVKVLYSSNIKDLYFDNGGEYINYELSWFLQDHRIVHETSCPPNP